MNIRTRLFVLIIPIVFAAVIITSSFSYYKWKKEINAQFKSSLEAVITAAATTIDPTEHEWLQNHMRDPNIVQHPLYIKYEESLKNISQKFANSSLSTIIIEPVSKTSGTQQKDGDLLFREVFVLPPSGKNSISAPRPGDETFFDQRALKTYTSKKVIISPFCEKNSSTQQFISAYAPIINRNGVVIGLVHAEVPIYVIEGKLQETRGIILIGGLLTVVLIMVGLIFIANNINQPIEKLKNAAIALAAGNYAKKIEVQGPREISELANTLNTMRECLKEHLQRLEENLIFREKMIGEVECIRVLSNKLFQNVVDSFSHPEIGLSALSYIGKSPFKPCVLTIHAPSKESLTFNFAQASLTGFEGIHDLIVHEHTRNSLKLALTKFEKHWRVRLSGSEHIHSFQWHAATRKITLCNDATECMPNDYIIVASEELFEHEHMEKTISTHFASIFRHFGDDLEATSEMLQKGLALLSQKKGNTLTLYALILHFQANS